jgi:Neurotransmitter-gated ion-channel transmembrane region
MAFIGIDNRRDLPKVSYSTALDVYVAACFAFVLLSILQFAGVHFFTKRGSGEPDLEIDSDDNEVDYTERSESEDNAGDDDVTNRRSKTAAATDWVDWSSVEHCYTVTDSRATRVS